MSCTQPPLAVVSPDLSGAFTANCSAGLDCNFSDVELTDMLGFFEKHESGCIATAPPESLMLKLEEHLPDRTGQDDSGDAASTSSGNNRSTEKLEQSATSLPLLRSMAAGLSPPSSGASVMLGHTLVLGNGHGTMKHGAYRQLPPHEPTRALDTFEGALQPVNTSKGG